MIRQTIWILTVFLVIISGISSGSAEPYDKMVVIGAKTFNEQYILADMISLLLEDQGYTTQIKSGMNEIPLYEGMKNGQIDVYVEYTGTAYSQVLKLPARTIWDPDAVYQEVVKAFMGDNIGVLGQIGFRDDYAIAIQQSYATNNGIGTISDLVPFAPELRFGSDMVFHERADGLVRLQELYGLTFKSVTPMAPTLMYTAITNNETDALPAYTTDSRIDLYDLKLLKDDKSAIPPYHAILLVRNDLMNDEKLLQSLTKLVDLIDTETMRRLNAQFDIDKKESHEIARDFLKEKGLISG